MIIHDNKTQEKNPIGFYSFHTTLPKDEVKPINTITNPNLLIFKDISPICIPETTQVYNLKNHAKIPNNSINCYKIAIIVFKEI